MSGSQAQARSPGAAGGPAGGRLFPTIEETQELQHFLKQARPEWSRPRRRGRSDAARVMRKLADINVTNIEELLKRIDENRLNEDLIAANHIRLSNEAIDSIRKRRPFLQTLDGVDVPLVRQVGRYASVPQMLARRRLDTASDGAKAGGDLSNPSSSFTTMASMTAPGVGRWNEQAAGRGASTNAPFRPGLSLSHSEGSLGLAAISSRSDGFEMGSPGGGSDRGAAHQSPGSDRLGLRGAHRSPVRLRRGGPLGNGDAALSALGFGFSDEEMASAWATTTTSPQSSFEATTGDAPPMGPGETATVGGHTALATEAGPSSSTSTSTYRRSSQTSGASALMTNSPGAAQAQSATAATPQALSSGRGTLGTPSSKAVQRGSLLPPLASAPPFSATSESATSSSQGHGHSVAPAISSMRSSTLQQAERAPEPATHSHSHGSGQSGAFAAQKGPGPARGAGREAGAGVRGAAAGGAGVGGGVATASGSGSGARAAASEGPASGWNTSPSGDRDFGGAGSSAAAAAAEANAISVEEIWKMQRAGAEMAKAEGRGVSKWSCKSSRSPLQQGQDMLKEQRAFDEQRRLLKCLNQSATGEGFPFRSHVARNIHSRLREEARRDAGANADGITIQHHCMNIRHQLASMVNARKELAGLRSRVQELNGFQQEREAIEQAIISERAQVLKGALQIRAQKQASSERRSITALTAANLKGMRATVAGALGASEAEGSREGEGAASQSWAFLNEGVSHSHQFNSHDPAVSLH